MPDKKKVIKGLEICYGPPSKCEDCPYHDLPDEQSCNDVLCLDALAVLKKHEQKAIEYHDNPFTGLPVAHCPNCMRYARQFDSSVEEETHFCPWCGQEVKWE